MSAAGSTPVPLDRAPPRDRFGLAGTELEGRFRVERVVAEGGFGVVYYATHLLLDRPVALKLLKTPGALTAAEREEFVAEFAREAKATVRLSHPNIVQVLDFGVTTLRDGARAPWMALEWLAGSTLCDLLLARRGQGGRSPADAMELLRPVFDALAYAHDEGIAHRDIKPANVMLVQGRRGEVVKLLDFGIAKAMAPGEGPGSGQTATANANPAFSLAYAAPEQIGTSRTGPWTDVHALALLLTEVLTDQSPFDGRDRTEVSIDALSPVRPTPRKRGIDVGAWEPVLARAAALRPSKRYPNAGAFLAALEGPLRDGTAVRRAGAMMIETGPVGRETDAPDEPSPAHPLRAESSTSAAVDALPGGARPAAAHAPTELIPPKPDAPGDGAPAAGTRAQTATPDVAASEREPASPAPGVNTTLRGAATTTSVRSAGGPRSAGSTGRTITTASVVVALAALTALVALTRTGATPRAASAGAPPPTSAAAATPSPPANQPQAATPSAAAGAAGQVTAPPATIAAASLASADAGAHPSQTALAASHDGSTATSARAALAAHRHGTPPGPGGGAEHPHATETSPPAATPAVRSDTHVPVE